MFNRRRIHPCVMRSQISVVGGKIEEKKDDGENQDTKHGKCDNHSDGSSMGFFEGFLIIYGYVVLRYLNIIWKDCFTF